MLDRRKYILYNEAIKVLQKAAAVKKEVNPMGHEIEEIQHGATAPNRAIPNFMTERICHYEK
jgi:hypothetical protein